MSWEDFVCLFKDSRDSVVLAGEWFKFCGFEVDVPPERLAPSRSKAKYFSDNGDILVRVDGVWREVDVKHQKTRDYRCREEMFPLTGVGKCRVVAKKPLPFAYAAVNKSMTHIAITTEMDMSKWNIQKDAAWPDGTVADTWRVPRKHWYVFSLFERVVDPFSRQAVNPWAGVDAAWNKWKKVILEFRRTGQWPPPWENKR